VEIQKNSYLNRAIDCNSFENQNSKEVATLNNPDLSEMPVSGQPDSYPCALKEVRFDPETHLLTLEIEHEGPDGASPVFYPLPWPGQNTKKGIIFILLPRDNGALPYSAKKIKAAFDLNDPKYAPFLNRFDGNEFKIRFIDAKDQFQDKILFKPGYQRPVARFTTCAIGEEGQDGGFIRPPQLTTQAIGEEGQDGSLPLPSKGHATTLAIGEEGQDGSFPPPSEGSATTLAIGEEGQDGGICRRPRNDLTTLALGEEGQESRPSIISDACCKAMGAIGDLIDRLTPKDPNPKISTCALGEEG